MPKNDSHIEYVNIQKNLLEALYNYLNTKPRYETQIIQKEIESIISSTLPSLDISNRDKSLDIEIPSDVIDMLWKYLNTKPRMEVNAICDILESERGISYGFTNGAVTFNPEIKSVRLPYDLIDSLSKYLDSKPRGEVKFIAEKIELLLKK